MTRYFVLFTLLLCTGNLHSQGWGKAESQGAKNQHPSITYFPVYQGKQIVFVDKVTPWTIWINRLEMEHPRALSWSMVHPQPQNPLIIRDEKGTILHFFFKSDDAPPYQTREVNPQADPESAFDPSDLLPPHKTTGKTAWHRGLPVYDHNHFLNGQAFNTSQPSATFPAQYIHINDFTGHYGIIDTLGNVVIPPVYQSISFVQDSLFILQGKDSAQLTTTSFQPIIPADIYKSITYLGHGIYAAGSDSLCLLINAQNAAVSPHRYTSVSPFYGGFAIAQRNGLFCHINAQGQELYEPRYQRIEEFSKGFARIFKADKKQQWLVGYIDLTGHEICPPVYWVVNAFAGTPPLSWVRRNKTCFYINTRGAPIADTSLYPFMGSYTEGMIIVKKQEKWGFLSPDGTVAVDCVFEQASAFSEGLARVVVLVPEQGRKYGYINKKGERVIPAVYDSAVDFQGGKASVSINNKRFFIDKTGEPVK